MPAWVVQTALCPTVTPALAHAPSHLTERATHAHPLHPAALASVPYVIVSVRVRSSSSSEVENPLGDKRFAAMHVLLLGERGTSSTGDLASKPTMNSSFF